MSSCCCRCNGSGRCKNCACVKAGQTCFSCLPGRRGRCQNTQSSTPTLDAQSSAPCSTSTQRSQAIICDEAWVSDAEATVTSDAVQSADVPLHTQDLPRPSAMAEAHFTWGPDEVSSEQFIQSINTAYAEVVHWKRNIFSVPSGKAGKAFANELARLFRSYADSSALECIALKAAMILPPLLLQKPTPKSKAQDHTVCLERRLLSWKVGNVESLLHEGRTIQSRLPKPKPTSTDQESTARAFAKLMFQGKTKAALRLITE